MLEDLDREDRRQRRRERGLVAAIAVIGFALALFIGYVITDVDQGYKSIKCERGQNVTLVLTKLDGTVERVSCPTEVEVRR